MRLRLKNTPKEEITKAYTGKRKEINKYMSIFL